LAAQLLEIFELPVRYRSTFVKFRSLVIAALLVLPAAAAENAPTATAPASTRIAVIRFQDAVLTTQEGRQASAALKAKYDPRKAQLEKRQADLQATQQKLSAGASNLTPEARTKLQDDLARGSRELQRDADDLNTDVQQDEGRIMGQMATKMSEIIQKYASGNGYSVVLDVSSQQTPVLWAAAASNISADIVKAYDAAYPVNTTAKTTAAK
jgi:outer membrane protein